MLRKKYLIISFLLIISIISISSISAADDSDNLLLEDNSLDDAVSANDGIDEVVGDGQSDNNEITSQNDQGTIQSTTGSFTELKNLINSQSTLNLSQDYEYKSSDSSFKNGIVINKKVVINGNGHSLYCHANRAFNVTSNGNLTLKNIKLIGDWSYAVSKGGAIYIQGGYVDLVNCNLTKFNVTQEGGAIWNNGTFIIEDYSAINQSFAFNGYGGAIMNYGTVNIWGAGGIYNPSVIFFNNYANKAGGAIYNNKHLYVSYAQFKSNQALGNTGAVYNNVTNPNEAYFLQCTFAHNFAGEGADALYNCYVFESFFLFNAPYPHTGVFMKKGYAVSSPDYNTRKYNSNQFINVTIATYLTINNKLTNFTEEDIGIINVTVDDYYNKYSGVKVVLKYTYNGQTHTLENITDSNGQTSFNLGELENGTYQYNIYIDSVPYTALSNKTSSFTVKKRESFTSLAALINKGSNITLSADYIFKPSDSAYKTGILINKKITINGNYHYIYCKDARIFNLGSNADVTIMNLNIVGNHSNTFACGGGILVQGGKLTIINSTLVNLSSNFEGAAIWNNGTLIVSEGTRFFHNHVIKINEEDESGGGAIINYGTLYVLGNSTNRVIFYNNSADFGGAIDNENQARIEYTYMYYNYAAECGGAVYNNMEKPELCIIIQGYCNENNAGDCGGVFYDCYAIYSVFLENNSCPNEGKYMLGGWVYNSPHQTNKNYASPYYVNTKIVTDLTATNNADNSSKIYFYDGDNCIVNITVSDYFAKYSGVEVVLQYLLNGHIENISQITDSNGQVSFNLGKLERGVYEYYVYTNSTAYLMWDTIYSNITVQKQIELQVTNLDISDIVNLTLGDVLNIDVKAIDINNPENNISGLRIILNVMNTTAGYDFYQAYTDENGIAHFKILQNLTVGVHEILMTQRQVDGTYVSNILGFYTDISKVENLTITANKVTSAYGDSTNINIKVSNKESKVYAGLKILIKLVSGSKTTNYYATTNAQGIASFNVKSLNKGSYVAQISIVNSTHIADPISTSVKITQKALTITPKVKNTAKGPSLMITIKDKSKAVNGIKIKLLVYTGKKYKTINLVTGKVSGKSGMCGMITNMFNKGKHKVVIQFTSANYKGKKTAYITITKKHKAIRNYYTYYTNGKKITKKV